MNVVRSVSSEGFGRIKYYTKVRRLLESDAHFRGYFEQETTELPPFYTDQIQKHLGTMWKWLPERAMHHDPNAYLKSQKEQAPAPVGVRLAKSSKLSGVYAEI
jgi:hypothetical protein